MKNDNVVPFPGNRLKPSPKRTDTVRISVENIEPQVLPTNSKIDFTCPHCHTQSSFKFENMIMKSLQFFCSNCGNGFKVNNPLLSGKVYDEKKAT
jgi:transcription elongation factor Elf1